MKRPPKQKRNRRGEPPEPTKLSRKDLLQIWGIIVFILGILGGGVAVGISHQKAAFATSLNRTIDGWCETYHLTGEQARRIREMEFAFHGNGNPLIKPAHGWEENASHHAEIAAVMDADDGARFLEDRQSRKSHP